MGFYCNNEYIKDDLAINIDISNIKSWDLNSGLTVNSINRYIDYELNDDKLLDYGLTQYDVGQVNNMYEDYIINNNKFFGLKPIKYNKPFNPSKYEYSGVTTITNQDNITPIYDNVNGNYFMLDGGYLNGCYKLYGYNYELLPSRFKDGITIENILYLNDNSSGIFYYMGVRSEDKYNPYFSGETNINGDEIDGVFTSENNYLESITEKDVLKNAFADYADRLKTEMVYESQLDNLKNNIIAFKITEDKKIGVSYIDNNGLIINKYSNNLINVTGKTSIIISYKPNEIINDVNCAPRRTGDLKIYVNGSLFWKLKDFNEFYFSEINNDKEKQIGVPYNINWGGGSFGLKHSWHYDNQTYILFDDTYNNTNISINNPNTSNIINGYDININNNNLIITNTGDTLNNNIFIEFNDKLKLLSNRKYEFTCKLMNTGIFDDSSYINSISLLIIGDENVYVVDDVVYDGKRINQWFDISTTINIEDNSKYGYFNVGLLINSHTPLNIGENIIIDNVKYSGSDIIVENKNNSSVIENNFNEPFNGGIQKLRIYLKYFNFDEVKNNVKFELNNYNKGGRIINR